MVTDKDLNGDGAIDQVDNVIVRNYVCFPCHSRGAGKYSAAGVKLSYFSRDDGSGKPLMYMPGLDWKEYYDISTTAGDYWGGDPTSGDFVASLGHHQQQQDFAYGSHRADKSFDHECFVCHDLHSRTNKNSVTTGITTGSGVKVITQNDDNTLCLACHA